MAWKNLFGYSTISSLKRALTLVTAASLITATTSLPVHAEDATSEEAADSEATDSSAANPSDQWNQVSRNARTHRSVAAANWGGREWYFVRGDDRTIWFSANGQDFTRHPHGGRTDAAPAAVVFHNTLYVFHTGEGGDIWYSFLTSQGWTAWQRVPGSDTQHFRTTESPTVAASERYLYLLGMRDNERIAISASDNGSRWANWDEPPGGARTLSAVGAAAAHNNSDGVDALVVAHRGTNEGVYYAARRESDGAWSTWNQRDPGARIRSQPFLASFVGLDGHEHIAVSAEGTDGRVWAQDWDIDRNVGYGWHRVDDRPNEPRVTTDIGPTLVWIVHALYCLAVSQAGVMIQKRIQDTK
ncbi:hypothetical protein LZC95_28905 [Pendulispora brunnea]|uniref:Uncharacterized protein n=1 Tax=Pendulispora brunnea TaxID=2905690 RepID=A0ABZ2JVH3_9BACT